MNRLVKDLTAVDEAVCGRWGACVYWGHRPAREERPCRGMQVPNVLNYMTQTGLSLLATLVIVAWTTPTVLAVIAVTLVPFYYISQHYRCGRGCSLAYRQAALRWPDDQRVVGIYPPAGPRAICVASNRSPARRC
jgi:hypothetical protein